MKSISIVHKLLLLLLLIPFSFSGCINETLPPCPPISGDTGIWFLPEFTKHTTIGEDDKYVDLFGETAVEMTVYIFDDSGSYIGQFPHNGPFQNGMKIPCTILTHPGTYRAVMWVNGKDFTHVIKPNDSTTLDQFLLSLKEIEEQQVNYQFGPLLYGQTDLFTYKNTADEYQEIPVSLIRDTHKIQVTVRWRNETTGKLCTDQYHADHTLMYLKDNNGIIDFENNKGQCPWLTYIPYYYKGAELEPYKDSTYPEAVTVAGQFSTMQLFTDSQTKLVFNTQDENGLESLAREFDLMQLIRETKAYDTQDAIDREEYFHIYIEFTCAETWQTVDIIINGWRLSHMDDSDL